MRLNDVMRAARVCPSFAKGCSIVFASSFHLTLKSVGYTAVCRFLPDAQIHNRQPVQHEQRQTRQQWNNSTAIPCIILYKARSACIVSSPLSHFMPCTKRSQFRHSIKWSLTWLSSLTIYHAIQAIIKHSRPLFESTLILWIEMLSCQSNSRVQHHHSIYDSCSSNALGMQATKAFNKDAQVHPEPCWRPAQTKTFLTI